MPLQNRVTPFGEIVAMQERGTIMGNRGVLHDGAGRIVRDAQVKRWIACVLEFRGRRRAVMQPRRWTELFFLDEATALSAGHRPCAECRNADYKRFRALWENCFGAPASADTMDLQLQADRIEDGRKKTYRAGLDSLPDGTYIIDDGDACLVRGTELLVWSPAGYNNRRPRKHGATVEVLTPRSTVAVLTAGYTATVHHTA
jgi:hypothetical protein